MLSILLLLLVMVPGVWWPIRSVAEVRMPLRIKLLLIQGMRLGNGVWRQLGGRQVRRVASVTTRVPVAGGRVLMGEEGGLRLVLMLASERVRIWAGHPVAPVGCLDRLHGVGVHKYRNHHLLGLLGGKRDSTRTRNHGH